jgi:hypothetical protein
MPRRAGRLDTREISNIGDSGLSFADARALATGNPLLIAKAEADAELACLSPVTSRARWHPGKLPDVSSWL